jgi:aminotransferase
MIRNAISRNVTGMELSAIKDMAMRSARVEGAVSLAWGVPSFQTPEHIRRAVARALENDPDIGKYALPDGLAELRAAVADAHHGACGIDADPDSEIMITCGNMQGLNSLFHALLDPGDEVILTDPGFASHVQQIGLCGGKPVYWRLDEARGWQLDIDALPGLVTPRTKAILLVSPSNPTGRIFSEAELRAVGRVAQDAGIHVLIDDPYSHFTYDSRSRYFNLASAGEYRENTLYLFTFSKCHAMSGWRLGYMILPAQLKRDILKVHDATIICTPRISQVAGIAALTGDMSHLAEFERILSRRRDLICERLASVSHVFRFARPEGGYYVFPEIVADHRDSYEFSLRLLADAHVTVTPGSALGPAGEHHVRMAYCVSEQAINESFDRIERYFGRG